ncbi:hypothetical protein [Streptomyces pactum]|uniref:Uncharacterized protein n=1 Tax=Streptomyces pactum TaxID=68249 RepID=A0A1S6J342_9ACTN|nr:hypothetical protein [Streptomyces pactum]AQS66176.1 hypothetical protein B1H29_03790 [Streptomyces pactum]
MTAIASPAPVVRAYSWGSRTAIPALLGQRPDGEPRAELRFGAHHAAPSPLTGRPGTPDPAAAIAVVPVGDPGEASLGSASLRSRPRRDSLGGILQVALTAPRRLVRAVADALPALAGSPGSWSSTAAAYATVAADFPDEPGLPAALLLNHVSRGTGEAPHVAAGVPHTCLWGTGVGFPANSDNVLRCGLTDKHVVVPAGSPCAVSGAGALLYRARDTPDGVS